MRIRIPIWDLESFFTVDPGFGMVKFGSGINISDPQIKILIYEGQLRMFRMDFYI